MLNRRAESFGEWLDTTMSNQEVKGRTLAEACAVADSAVSRWRSGRAQPPMESIEPMAHILGVDALRLAVTAGLIPARVAGTEPLPMPEPTETQNACGAWEPSYSSGQDG